jgi:hypothetical protein
MPVHAPSNRISGLARARGNRAIREGEVIAMAQDPSVFVAQDVAAALNRARQVYTLIGAYAVNPYSGQPRATRDVDVVARDPAAAREVLLAAFPRLKDLSHPDEDAFTLGRARRPDIDILHPVGVFAIALRHTRRVLLPGRISAAIPTLEAMLVLKFLAMTSTRRAEEQRLQDRADFIRMVAHAEGRVDLAQVTTIASLGGFPDTRVRREIIRIQTRRGT